MATSRTARFSFVLALTGALPVAARADGFSLGVAAGDVMSDSVILWTRADQPGDIRVSVSLDENFATLVTTATAAAGATHDNTVKFDIGGLAPSTNYFYRFENVDSSGASSASGRFRTAAAGNAAARLRVIFSGDSNFAFAPFTAFGAAAREDADLFIWFGDTIYADVTAGGLGPAQTLDDYRGKYRQVRGDPNVQALLAKMAVLVGGDDHEVTNDYAGLDPDLSLNQKLAAYQAFFEYMPIREQRIAGDEFRTYRRLRFGSAVEFFMLDERQYRDPSAQAACRDNLDPDGFLLGPLSRRSACVSELRAARQMLGEAQFAWLTAGLANTDAPLKLVVNNVPLSYLGVFPYDRWDGYDEQRRELLRFIDDNAIAGIAFLTTDIHANAYNPDLMSYFRSRRRDYGLSGRASAAELIAGPIGNETFGDSVSGIIGGVAGAIRLPAVNNLVGGVERLFVRKVTRADGLDFVDLNRVSYVVLDISVDGEMEFTYRGLRPGETDPAAVETFFEGALPQESRHTPASGSTRAPSALPCGLPFFALIALCPLWLRRRSAA